MLHACGSDNNVTAVVETASFTREVPDFPTRWNMSNVECIVHCQIMQAPDSCLFLCCLTPSIAEHHTRDTECQ